VFPRTSALGKPFAVPHPIRLASSASIPPPHAPVQRSNVGGCRTSEQTPPHRVTSLEDRETTPYPALGACGTPVNARPVFGVRRCADTARLHAVAPTLPTDLLRAADGWRTERSGPSFLRMDHPYNRRLITRGAGIIPVVRGRPTGARSVHVQAGAAAPLPGIMCSRSVPLARAGTALVASNQESMSGDPVNTAAHP
jgi:hypothetical protein